MNRFTTDHPLAAQASVFDVEEHPIGSFFWSSVLLALLVTPVLYGWAMHLAFADEVQCTDDPPFPDSCAEFLLGAAVFFLFCLICAGLIVFMYRLFSWYFRKEKV